MKQTPHWQVNMFTLRGVLYYIRALTHTNKQKGFSVHLFLPERWLQLLVVIPWLICPFLHHLSLRTYWTIPNPIVVPPDRNINCKKRNIYMHAQVNNMLLSLRVLTGLKDVASIEGLSQ